MDRFRGLLHIVYTDLDAMVALGSGRAEVSMVLTNQNAQENPLCRLCSSIFI